MTSVPRLMQLCSSLSEPSSGMLLYALADEGIVGFIDPNGAETTDRFLVGRSLRPVAVAYDPVHQVSTLMTLLTR